MFQQGLQNLTSKEENKKIKKECYGCNEKGHELASCSHNKDDCKSLNKRQTGNKQIKNQDEKKKKTSCNDKQHICYTYRRKGHISKNCLMGKISKPNSSIDHSLLRKAKMELVLLR
jgi:hypothetical protein